MVRSREPMGDAPVRTGEVRVDEVRVVWVWAEAPGPVWESCFSKLTAEERARALRMRAGQARDEFVTGRAALRVLLEQGDGAGAAGPVEIRTGLHGRPEVEGRRFSVAHARGLIGLAFSQAGAVGLDVEWLDRTVEAREIAGAHFAPGEMAAVAAAADAAAIFFQIWTRKEAAVKAVGVGLGAGLASFCTAGGERAELQGETVYLRWLEMGEVPGAERWVGHVALAGGRPAVRMEVLATADLLKLLAGGADVRG